MDDAFQKIVQMDNSNTEFQEHKQSWDMEQTLRKHNAATNAFPRKHEQTIEVKILRGTRIGYWNTGFHERP